MKNQLRSSISTQGRKMVGARSLWRANGMKEDHFGKPLIAIVNSFTQFVPGHAHLQNIGQVVKSIIEKNGCFAAEFNTIAIDDGIAMGHDGMLYSLPSREIIADSVEYMCNAHKADAIICISNCDKITPGMLMASMRLNIPSIFVSGGPMEAGTIGDKKLDMVDAIVMGADDNIDDEQLLEAELNACPTCGSCSGMFTANSMNILTEALGLSLPGTGTIVATHVNRRHLFEKAAIRIVEMAHEYYHDGNDMILPRSIATKEAFQNAMTLDMAMGGSTNTILHLLAIANEAEVDFNLSEIDRLSQTVPCICKVAPNSHYHIEDVNRAGGVLSIMGELRKKGLLNTGTTRADSFTLEQAINRFDICSENANAEATNNSLSAPGGYFNLKMASQNKSYKSLDTDRARGCVRDIDNAYHADGGLAVLYGNLAQNGCIVKTAGVDESQFVFTGTARICESQDEACNRILSGEIVEGDILVIRYEGPKGGPGMQEMLYPTSYLKSKGLEKKSALITDGRFSGGTSGLSVGHISPEAAAGGNIALVCEGDLIEINIPERSINVLIEDKVMQQRRADENNKEARAFLPANRNRTVSKALQAYALCASSADKGGIRILPGEGL